MPRHLHDQLQPYRRLKLLVVEAPQRLPAQVLCHHRFAALHHEVARHRHREVAERRVALLHRLRRVLTRKGHPAGCSLRKQVDLDARLAGDQVGEDRALALRPSSAARHELRVSAGVGLRGFDDGGGAVVHAAGLHDNVHRRVRRLKALQGLDDQLRLLHLDGREGVLVLDHLALCVVVVLQLLPVFALAFDELEADAGLAVRRLVAELLHVARVVLHQRRLELHVEVHDAVAVLLVVRLQHGLLRRQPSLLRRVEEARVLLEELVVPRLDQRQQQVVLLPHPRHEVGQRLVVVRRVDVAQQLQVVARDPSLIATVQQHGVALHTLPVDVVRPQVLGDVPRLPRQRRRLLALRRVHHAHARHRWVRRVLRAQAHGDAAEAAAVLPGKLQVGQVVFLVGTGLQVEGPLAQGPDGLQEVVRCQVQRGVAHPVRVSDVVVVDIEVQDVRVQPRLQVHLELLVPRGVQGVADHLRLPHQPRQAALRVEGDKRVGLPEGVHLDQLRPLQHRHLHRLRDARPLLLARHRLLTDRHARVEEGRRVHIRPHHLDHQRRVPARHHPSCTRVRTLQPFIRFLFLLLLLFLFFLFVVLYRKALFFTRLCEGKGRRALLVDAPLLLRSPVHPPAPRQRDGERLPLVRQPLVRHLHVVARAERQPPAGDDEPLRRRVVAHPGRHQVLDHVERQRAAPPVLHRLGHRREPDP
eukprot:Rhum_TRINITY_DN13481_c0_g1::Rhum_TRINITY_DN13481_c0_g1_i1::g.59854::m.59854